MKNLLIIFALAFSLQAVAQYNGRGVDLTIKPSEQVAIDMYEGSEKTPYEYLEKASNQNLAAWSCFAAALGTSIWLRNTDNEFKVSPPIICAGLGLCFKFVSIYNNDKAVALLNSKN